MSRTLFCLSSKSNTSEEAGHRRKTEASEGNRHGGGKAFKVKLTSGLGLSASRLWCLWERRHINLCLLMRLELPHRLRGDSVCFLPAWPADLHAAPSGGNAAASCTWKHTAEARLAGGGTRRQLRKKSFHLLGPSPLRVLKRSLLHVRLSSFICAPQTATLCVKGWPEGYNLEETWEPITDTNIQSPHAALSPPGSHIMVTAAGLCLPGTRRRAGLSRCISPLHSTSCC